MFRLPTFNLTCDIYTGPNPGTFRLSSPCNLALGKRVNVVSTGGTNAIGIPLLCMWLLLPAGTDIRGPLNLSGEDVVEVPAGSGRYYNATWVDDIGKGFTNEHRFAALQQFGLWPTPIP